MTTTCQTAVVSLPSVALIEQQHREWFAAEHVVPGVEVHEDADITWIVHNGQAWRNAGIMVRFSRTSAAGRLDTLIARYRKHKRGMALWISQLATPANLPELLAARRLRCRKHFPGMLRVLNERVPRLPRVSGLEIRPVANMNEFADTPYPSIGPLTTTLRQQAFARLQALLSEPTGRTRLAVARFKGSPVGAIEFYVGSEAAGVHGLSVLEAFQRRGIGSALLEHACQEARASRVSAMALLATTEGQQLYSRRGFAEAARFGYWYRSFQRGS
jgi:GNAT superfamily N-acetyltransferase